MNARLDRTAHTTAELDMLADMAANTAAEEAYKALIDAHKALAAASALMHQHNRTADIKTTGRMIHAIQREIATSVKAFGNLGR